MFTDFNAYTFANKNEAFQQSNIEFCTQIVHTLTPTYIDSQ